MIDACQVSRRADPAELVRLAENNLLQASVDYVGAERTFRLCSSTGEAFVRLSVAKAEAELLLRERVREYQKALDAL